MPIDVEKELARLHRTKADMDAIIHSIKKLDLQPTNRALIKTPHKDSRKIIKRSDLRMAAILDDFSHNCFEQECKVINLGIGNWKAEIDDLIPDILFIESAWDGKNGDWHKKVSVESEDVTKLISHCRSKSIPIVFWNKEDPIHYEKFLWIAKKADWIFTTDIDCIGRYKLDTGIKNVSLMPFAASPYYHNPVEKYERSSCAVFAGAYYPNFKDRIVDTEKLLSIASETVGLDIWDRNYKKADSENRFPDKYTSFIRGGLDHKDMDKAYRGYKYGLSVSTIKNSQTMFARRVFEQLASNTPTISTYNRAIHNIFGDLVVSSDDENLLRGSMEKLRSDERFYRHYRLLGLRKVLTEHTYGNRLECLIERVLKTKVAENKKRLSLVAFIDNNKEWQNIEISISDFRENHCHKYIVYSRDVDERLLATRIPNIKFIPLESAGDKRISNFVKDEYLGIIDGQNYYGPHYFADLVLALSFVDATGIGKASEYVSDGKDISLHKDGNQYRFVDSLRYDASIIKTDVVSVLTLKQLKEKIIDEEIKGVTCFSIDEFNFVRNVSVGNPFPMDVEDIESGITAEELQRKGDEILVIDEATERRIIDNELHNFLRGFGNFDNRSVKWTDSVRSRDISSSLNPEEHSYSKFRAPIPKKDFLLVDKLFSRMDASRKGALDISLAFVCLDAKKVKLESLFVRPGRPLDAKLPDGCEFVWPWIRASNSGEASIEGISIGGTPRKIFSWIKSGEYLLITNIYPSYGDLYKNQFVHKRVLAYKDNGLKMDVFKFSYKEEGFSEYEGVQIISGQKYLLDGILKASDYKGILVHFLQPEVWDVIKEYRDICDITIWVHGFEIQPWQKRVCNYTDDEALEKAQLDSDTRMAFWRKVFVESGDRVKFVFISNYLLTEALSDVGVQKRPEFHVVNNFIDTDRFSYETKDPNQRKKILSIRPYATPIYANDLTVKCILELSKRQFFEQLEFLLIGDGALFESVLEPLKDFKNVRLDKRFLTADEISALHKNYGVFLVPTRMDSQGVSRDEAMSSGLVPITNRVAAIPEFVDDTSGMIAEAEDYVGMANLIQRLYDEPELFLKLSEGASSNVRKSRGKIQTIEKEIEIFGSETPKKFNLDAADPDISVVVTAYNIEDYIGVCLDSIVSQTTDNIEILVIESSSDDRTGEIVDDYGSRFPRRVKVIHTPRRGQGAARNLGIETARGRYIGFVDGDDFVEKNMFQEMFETANKESADIVVCDYCFLYPEGKTKHIDSLGDRGFKDIRSNLLMSGTTACWNKLFKKELIKDRKFEEDISAEDFRFVVTSIIDAEKISHLNKNLYNYRQRTDSTLGSLKQFGERNFELFQAYERTLEYVKNTHGEVIDALLDRMVINAFNWRVDDIHNIEDPVIRATYMRRWGDELNRIIPGWQNRSPVKKWISNHSDGERIVDSYANGLKSRD
ncbi:MAG: glycosyltransferase [Methanomassiliicoccales archaeon]